MTSFLESAAQFPPETRVRITHSLYEEGEEVVGCIGQVSEVLADGTVIVVFELSDWLNESEWACLPAELEVVHD